MKKLREFIQGDRADHGSRGASPAFETRDASAYRGDEGLAPDGFPITPAAFRHSSAESFEGWMADGREHFHRMLEILARNGFEEVDPTRVLDFGCSSGRTVRQWGDKPWAEVWGCDLSPERIAWCQHNLGERFRFVQNQERPPLPFEDRTFDLVYAGSVFTHISRGIDTWLLELRRTLRAGGWLYLTIHDETTWQVLREGGAPVLDVVLRSAPDLDSPQLPHDFIAVGRDAASQVFHRSRCFRELVEPFYTVVDFVPRARGYQSAFLLRKPS